MCVGHNFLPAISTFMFLIHDNKKPLKFPRQEGTMHQSKKTGNTKKIRKKLLNHPYRVGPKQCREKTKWPQNGPFRIFCSFRMSGHGGFVNCFFFSVCPGLRGVLYSVRSPWDCKGSFAMAPIVVRHWTCQRLPPEWKNLRFWIHTD